MHFGRTASDEELVERLTTARWTVLGDFARANRFSRTPSPFAAFHGTIRGTAAHGEIVTAAPDVMADTDGGRVEPRAIQG